MVGKKGYLQWSVIISMIPAIITIITFCPFKARTVLITIILSNVFCFGTPFVPALDSTVLIPTVKATRWLLSKLESSCRFPFQTGMIPIWVLLYDLSNSVIITIITPRCAKSSYLLWTRDNFNFLSVSSDHCNYHSDNYNQGFHWLFSFCVKKRTTPQKLRHRWKKCVTK